MAYFAMLSIYTLYMYLELSQNVLTLVCPQGVLQSAGPEAPSGK